jgi:hypothetical protein
VRSFSLLITATYTDFSFTSAGWTVHENTDLIMSVIAEDADIQNALFPSPGAHASTQKGGSKTKIEHQAHLAKLAFQDHPRYGSAYRADKQSGNKKRLQAWALKIKNRLDA